MWCGLPVGESTSGSSTQSTPHNSRVPDRITDPCCHPLLPRPPRKNKEALYKFSKVFPEDTPQQAIYSGVAQAMVSDLVGARQQEGVIMAYGVTSAGKTFTMQVRVQKAAITCSRERQPGVHFAFVASIQHGPPQALPMHLSVRP